MNDAYRQIGVLISMHNSIEAGLAMLVATVGGFANSQDGVQAMGALGISQQGAMLKSFAEHYPTERDVLRQIVKKAEQAASVRNRAAHGVVGMGPEGAVIVSLVGSRGLGGGNDAGMPIVEIQSAVAKYAEVNRISLEVIERFKAAWQYAHVQRLFDPEPDIRALLNRYFAALQDGTTLHAGPQGPGRH